MANNVEKFVIDLGFSAKDLKQLKELLKLQEQSQKAAKVHNKQQRDAKAKELAMERKKLQMLKLIAKAEKEGVDVSKYKRSLAAVKSIATLEKRRIELDELHFKAKEANDKKRQAAKQKELATERKITKEVTQRQFNNMPPRKLFEKAQAAKDKQAYSSAEYLSLADSYARDTATRARRIGLPESQVETLKEQARTAYGTRAAVKSLNATLNELSLKQREATMRARKHNLALQGLNDSTRHLIRSYASVFAVLGATQAINTTGQKFEAMQSAMLAATGTAGDAANEIAFLDTMTSRLGLSLLDTSDAYTKFLFASKGKLDQSETRELFEGLSELGTTLGVSKERMKLSMNAITQMMNKGKISSEELRLQLAESLPGAIQIFARSIGKSEAELFKMMENGELLAADVLPKVAKEMKAVAAVGLESKLDTLRVAQGQFFNELEKSNKDIFDGAFSDGLKELFKTVRNYLINNRDDLRGLGQMFKVFFNIVQGSVSFLLPVIGTFAEVIGTLASSMDMVFGEDAINSAVSKVGILTLAISKLARKIAFVVAAFDELFALFKSGKIGIIERLIGVDIGTEIAKDAVLPRKNSFITYDDIGASAKALLNSKGVFTSFTQNKDNPSVFQIEVNANKDMVETTVNGVIQKSNRESYMVGSY